MDNMESETGRVSGPENGLPAAEPREGAAVVEGAEMGRLYLLAINEEGFVFDPTTGESFTVNSTGLEVLKGLKERKTMEEIALRLTELFIVEKDEAERDATDFVDQLRYIKLL